MTSTRASIVITPTPSGAQYWRDLWRYRHLAYNLAWRDVAVRYKQTVLGVLWAVIRPLSTMLVFTAVFGVFARFTTDTVPYAVMVLAGLVCYQFFSAVLNSTSTSVLGNSNMISKIYFPRLLAPLSTSLSALVDFAIALVILFLLMAHFGVAPTWRLLFMPLFLAVSLLLSLGAGLWFAAFAVRYRDVLHIVPFLLQLALYLSPVAYPRAEVPEKYQMYYAFNPLVGVVDGFRWSVLGTDEFSIDPVATTVSVATALVLMATGVAHFRRVEHRFVDDL